MKIVVIKTKQYEKAMQIADSTRDYFETGMQQLAKDIKLHFLYGAFVKEKIVGFITYNKINMNTIEISWLAVLPKYRNKGIGAELVRQTLDRLKKEYQVCEVKTLAETHPDLGYARTRNFYKKLGFISLKIIDPYPAWGKDNPCQIFIKKLR